LGKICEVNQHFVRAASIAGGLADNVSEAILGRIDIDHLRAIDDPVTTGQDAPLRWAWSGFKR
jgi:hypothetical protein